MTDEIGHFDMATSKQYVHSWIYYWHDGKKKQTETKQYFYVNTFSMKNEQNELLNVAALNIKVNQLLTTI